MTINIFLGIMIPFVGTALGSGLVFFLTGKMNNGLRRALTGFAAGVMVAASVWSLLIPSIDQSSHMGKLSFVPAVVGFLLGMIFLLAKKRIITGIVSCGNFLMLRKLPQLF